VIRLADIAREILGAPTPPPTAPTAAVSLFASLEAFVGHIQGLAGTGGELPWADLEALMGRVVDHLAGSDELFWVATTRTIDAETDYLAFHHARVAVMATRIGENLGYLRDEQLVVGMAGCLFDLGLAGVPLTLLRTAEGLPPADHALYRDHPRRAAALVRNWAAPHPSIEQAVLHHHERERGQGYPDGRSGAGIHPHGKILGVLDLYTRLTVPPAWQLPRAPHEAVREIVKTRNDAFPGDLIKALLAEISVFPPGTLVRLNTGDTALVVEANRHQPLRPKLALLGGTREINLVDTPFMYIVGPAGDGE
jgi:HD-GYP domain-containing protein (c-di-GMP phosphodiesterase class II)